MRIVAAIGGNALLRRNDPADLATLRGHVHASARALADIAREHQLVVSFGHGPQVAIRTQSPPRPDLPLDLVTAMTGGGVSYFLEQAIQNELGAETTASIATHVLVDAQDAAFVSPTTPVGERSGRLVACPTPLRVLQAQAIEALLAAGITVVTSAAGGIPVALDEEGRLAGLDAIVDRDLAAALLAQALDAELFLVLANIKQLDLDWGTWATRPLERTTPGALRTVLYEFAQGTISPMIEGACRYVEATGRRAAIGALAEAAAVIEGAAGTQIVPDREIARHPV